jgi:hypothetical protein
MKPLRTFQPGLRDCALEHRLLPAISNLGTIVLTTSGYVLEMPFPSTLVYPGNSPGGGTSSAASGTFVAPGTQPGNGASLANLGLSGTSGAAGGAGLTVAVGSGASDPTALNIPVVTRNTIAFDTPTWSPRVGRLSGDHSPVLPDGQVYRGGFPEPAQPSAPENERAGPPLGQRPVNPFPIPQDGADRSPGTDLTSAAPRPLP